MNKTPFLTNHRLDTKEQGPDFSLFFSGVIKSQPKIRGWSIKNEDLTMQIRMSPAPNGQLTNEQLEI
jgi:hypothetical protein